MNDTLDEKEALQVTHRVQIEIGWGSIFRLCLAVLLAYLAIMLWPIFKLLILAILMAVALHPLVDWVVRKGGPRWLGLLLATATVVVVLVGCFAIIAPIGFRQMGALGENLPHLRQQIIAQMPGTGPVRQALENGMSPGTVADSRLLLERMLRLLEMTIGGLVYVVVVVALATYLLADGPRALRWLIVFVPEAQRGKISQALRQIYRLISSYVAGQFFISVLAATYLFVVLWLLGVPMALLLGIVAGFCDILPVIGFFIAVFLAMVIGLTISPATALLILALYGAYHLFENFFIVPRVYGKTLKLSKLAVPLAVAAGGVVAGVVGAIAVLPLVAAYPVVERLWLAHKLAPDTLKAHGDTTE